MNSSVLPSRDQTQQVYAILAQKEADLSRLDLEISRVQAHLNQLFLDRREAYKHIEAHRALVAPIRRLPLEILQEIFIHCLPSGDYIKPDALKAPLLLAQVCVLWRQAALSTPQLWSSLAIQVSEQNHDRRFALMNSWLTRSTAHPFSLFAYLPVAIDDALIEFLQILDSSLDRWKDLRLTLPLRCNAPVLDAFKKGLPLLERLDLKFSPVGYPLHAVPLTSRFYLTDSSAPRLRVLSWRCNSGLDVPISVHTTRLTDINVDYFSVLQCLELLRNCPKVISCQFRDISKDSTIPTDILMSSPVLLPNLQSLTLVSTQPLDVLFDHVTLPGLRTLKVTDMCYVNDGPRVWSLSQFTALLARSECALECLHLLNVLASEDELIQTLQWTTNSLVELRLLDLRDITPVMDRILGLFTPRETTDGRVTCLCPRLEVIKLGRSLASSDGVLATMVESRWKYSSSGEGVSGEAQIARLKFIDLRLGADHPDDIKRLASLCDKGLKLL